jgi:uncharacterized protein (TIGR00369 family)
MRKRTWVGRQAIAPRTSCAPIGRRGPDAGERPGVRPGRRASRSPRRRGLRSRSLRAVVDRSASSDRPDGAGAAAGQPGSDGAAARLEHPGALDGITGFMGMRWEDPQTVRLTIRPELINRGGLLSGVVGFALVDYCMGSTLWAQTTAEERIATINISINYVQTAVEGDVVCRTTLDRRNRRTAVMRSEVRHDDGRLLATAIGSYTIFTKAPPAGSSPGSA